MHVPKSKIHTFLEQLYFKKKKGGGLSLMFQLCKISYIPYLVVDSYLPSETFKKSFPDGITGNP